LKKNINFIKEKPMKTKLTLLSFLAIAALLLSACGGAKSPAAGKKLPVLATTSIVADVVRQVGGDYVQVTTLLPLGTDPHTFQPRPQDAAAIADATLVFANGAGLEEFLQPLLESAGATDNLVEVSQGIDLLPFEGEEGEGEHHHEGGDPHTWMDPNNVMVWTDNIAAALSAADPAHADAYRANAAAYREQLRALDEWIRAQVSPIPVEQRLFVSDHATWGYFAEEYGFRQVGTITASFSSAASPSAQELAALEEKIRAWGVKVILVGVEVNPNLAQQVAQDTGARIVRVYHGSLTPADGPAATYLDFMRYNVTAIVDALK
jgi:ABC-type Zn uptake system ZnuABC Zn-binding protein ZnuA